VKEIEEKRDRSGGRSTSSVNYSPRCVAHPPYLILGAIHGLWDTMIVCVDQEHSVMAGLTDRGLSSIFPSQERSKFIDVHFGERQALQVQLVAWRRGSSDEARARHLMKMAPIRFPARS